MPTTLRNDLTIRISKLARELRLQARNVDDLYPAVSMDSSVDRAIARFNAASHERWERSKLYTVVAVHEALLEAGLRYAESKPAAFAGMVEARGRPAGRPVRKPEASPKE